MAELNTPNTNTNTSRFEGVGFEITKVVYIFSMVSVIGWSMAGASGPSTKTDRSSLLFLRGIFSVLFLYLKGGRQGVTA